MRSITWVLLLGACSTSSRAPAPDASCPELAVSARAYALQRSLPARTVDRCLVAEAREVALELRDALVETDERATQTPRGHAALEAALGALPGPIESAGPLRCAGECCDVVRAGMSPSVTYLRRVCFANAGHVSLVSLARARSR